MRLAGAPRREPPADLPKIATLAVLVAIVAILPASGAEPQEAAAPEDPRRLVALADQLVRADRLPEAEDVLRRAQQAMPDAVPIAVNRASLLFRLSRYAEADKVVRTVFDRSPLHPVANYLLGAIAMRTGGPSGGTDPEAAARHAEVALAGFSEQDAAGRFRRAETLYLLGEARLALGEEAAGESAVRASLEIAPFQPGPRYLLARRLIRAGRREEGRRELEVFAKAKATSEAVAHARSLFHDANQPDIAESSLRHALTLWPGHPPALRLLAQILTATGRTEEAQAIRSRLGNSRTR